MCTLCYIDGGFQCGIRHSTCDILKPGASAVAVHVSAARAEGIIFIGLCCSLLEGLLPVQG
jgi:hypothetical protein